MSNITLMRLTKLQPLFHMVGNSYAALASVDVAFQPNIINNNNNNNYYVNSNGNNVEYIANNNHSNENFLVLLEENYSYRSTSTIVLMVAAWVLLILGFVFCCCAECFGISVWRGKKRASISLSGVESGAASSNVAAAVNADELSDLHADRANHSDATIEVCRHCPPDYEAESLPSYTIVSGLPTYDDALEEFRKAGIILTPAIVPVIKIFEHVNNEAGGAKEPAVAYSLVETTPAAAAAIANGDANADNISLTSITCNCGGGGTSPTTSLPSYSAATAAAMASQIIELSPEHLASLSQKRLSLQISFNNSLRRRSRSTLRNHLLRSRAVGNTVGLGPIEPTNLAAPTAAATTTTAAAGVASSAAPASRDCHVLPPIHRSSSTLSLSNERQLLDQRLRHLHHRGSLY
ncbi:uncharacterized protein LOC117567606 isoform X2 [Drosophila albomicans]|uniref:Uncharacterized protein LOC117567606 isoform X2 n=1 Tax=Drosophila albomicans TaxID=7291 RepID=A0A6P8WYA9_DROAB|nr:uncharacterized protein LOC117567606 isoform X2 [Drosophila albomicans]